MELRLGSFVGVRCPISALRLDPLSVPTAAPRSCRGSQRAAAGPPVTEPAAMVGPTKRNAAKPPVKEVTKEQHKDLKDKELPKEQKEIKEIKKRTSLKSIERVKNTKKARKLKNIKKPKN